MRFIGLREPRDDPKLVQTCTRSPRPSTRERGDGMCPSDRGRALVFFVFNRVVTALANPAPSPSIRLKSHQSLSHHGPTGPLHHIRGLLGALGQRGPRSSASSTTTMKTRIVIGKVPRGMCVPPALSRTRFPHLSRAGKELSHVLPRPKDHPEFQLFRVGTYNLKHCNS